MASGDESGDYMSPVCCAWLEVTVTDPVAEAKDAKLAQINAVTTGLNEADYTAESWAALQSALTAARNAVNAATTVAAVNAVAVPTTSALLKPTVTPTEPTCLEKWQAKLPDWLSGIISLPNWVQWIIMIGGFGWIWWLFK